MELGEGFITFEQLQTFPVQVFVVLLLTHVLKAMRPALDAYWLRFTAVVVGIAVSVGVALVSGPVTWQILLMAPLNGVIVSFFAIKTKEFLAGSTGNGLPGPLFPAPKTKKPPPPSPE